MALLTSTPVKTGWLGGLPTECVSVFSLARGIVGSATSAFGFPVCLDPMGGAVAMFPYEGEEGFVSGGGTRPAHIPLAMRFFASLTILSLSLLVLADTVLLYGHPSSCG